MKLSPELEEICTCNNLDHTILNYYCPANGNEGSPCPVCGDYTLYSDAPKNAPDFLCRDCHEEKMSDDAEWRDQTLVRKSSDFVEYADGDQFLIVLDLYTSCPNECGEKYIPILYEAIEGHDPMYILGCGKCGFLDDDWDPKYVYEKEDGQIIKYYRESSDFDVVPMHPSLKNAEDEEYICPHCATDYEEEGLELSEKFTCPMCDGLIWENYLSRGHHLNMTEEALDYEGVEDQAVMFDVLNMVEANDLWNEIVFELIARGDAVRRPDGKIIFTDQAPQYDIIEDIAEYTSSQFEFNADGDIK